MPTSFSANAPPDVNAALTNRSALMTPRLRLSNNNAWQQAQCTKEVNFA